VAGSQRREKRPWPGDGVWFVQAIASFVGAAGLVFVVARLFASSGAAAMLAFVAGGVAVVVLANRYEGEWTSRRNPAPEDYVLTTRQRLLFLVIGAPCLGLSALLGPEGLDPDHAVLIAASYVFGFMGFVLLFGAIFGMYSGD
jgi:hypothetical protein